MGTGAALGSLGIRVTIQTGGLLDLFCTIERTRPVTAVPFGLAVAARPLNCAMRKRRTSFWSAISNVNIKLSCAHVTIAADRYSYVNIDDRRSTAAAQQISPETPLPSWSSALPH